MRSQIILNYNISPNGKILELDGGGVVLDSLDEYRVYEIQKSVDAEIIDLDTVLKWDEQLAAKAIRIKKQTYVVLDPQCEIPFDSKIFDTAKVILVVRPNARGDKIASVRRKCKTILFFDQLNITKVLWRLYEEGIKKVLVEASDWVLERFIEENLIDEIYINIIPVFLSKGKDFMKNITANIDLELVGIRQYGDRVSLHYKVKKKSILNKTVVKT